MATATQQQPNGQQAATAAPAKGLLEQVLERETEYIPFLAKESIKLTPGMVIKFLCKPTKSGKLCTSDHAVRFIMLCKARGLNPWEGDAFIVGYDITNGPSEFNLVTAHQAFLKRAEVHPEYDGMESGVTVRDGEKELHDIPGDYVDDGLEVVGGWAKVHFKNRRVPMYKRLRLSTFHTGRSRWQKDAAGMIVKCAEADALRSSFPNSLGGMYLDDEMPRESDRADRAAVPMPRAVEQPTNLPKAESEASGQHETITDEHTQPEPTEENQDADTDHIDSAGIAALEKVAAQQGTLHSWRKTVKELYKCSPAELTAAQAADELARLEACLAGA